jgi:hypothetical protein
MQQAQLSQHQLSSHLPCWQQTTQHDHQQNHGMQLQKQLPMLSQWELGLQQQCQTRLRSQQPYQHQYSLQQTQQICMGSQMLQARRQPSQLTPILQHSRHKDSQVQRQYSLQQRKHLVSDGRFDTCKLE